MVRVRTRCAACEEHLNLGEEQIRLVREQDSPAHYLCYQCPTCSAEARTVVRADTLRSLLDAGVERLVVTAVEHPADEWPDAGSPFDQDDLGDFLRELERPSHELMAELERLVARDDHRG